MINNPYQQQINGYVPQYNPYQYASMSNMQRYQAQPEQMMPAQMPVTPQAIGINGRVVQGLDNINANEVPMDGSMAFFPEQDLSEIYVKGWNADGTIKTIVYTPHIDTKSIDTVNSTANAEKLKFTLSDESTDLFLNKFNELSEKIGQLEDRFDKSLATQRKNSKTQSKGGEEE